MNLLIKPFIVRREFCDPKRRRLRSKKKPNAPDVFQFPEGWILRKLDGKLFLTRKGSKRSLKEPPKQLRMPYNIDDGKKSCHENRTILNENNCSMAGNCRNRGITTLDLQTAIKLVKNIFRLWRVNLYISTMVSKCL
jgi:hypothetical protein